MTAAVRRHRGGVLLEVVLAISIFVGAGLAILTLVDRSLNGLARSRDAQRAASLARTAMSLIEAGIESPQTMVGPVREWDPALDDAALDDSGDGGAAAAFDDAPPEPSGWELEIQTEPAGFEGLTRVTVRAFRRVSEQSEQESASYTLMQLVRMGGQAADIAGEEDPLMEEARRGLPRKAGER